MKSVFKFFLNFCLNLICGLFIFQSEAFSQTTSKLTLFVGTGLNADNGNEGLYEYAPLKTLQYAHDLVASNIRAAPTNIWDIKIYVLSGTYWGQSVSWTTVPAQGSITIIGLGTTRPIFDGRLSSSQTKSNSLNFLSFRPSRSGTTNFRVSFLQIQYYLEGITFAGRGTSDPLGSINGNQIDNSIFSKIGDVYSTVLDSAGSPKYGMAVVRVLNSKNSRFHGNDFIDIKNIQEHSSFHAYYNANYATSNIYDGNKFLRNMSGTVVRFRDYSNENLVQFNLFESHNLAAIELWHCESAVRTDCTKKTESPSYNNKENKNYYYSNTLSGTEPFKIYYPGSFGNPQLYTGAVYNIIEGSKISSGFLTRSKNSSNQHYGFCSNSTSCVNQNGACFANLYANTTITCQNSNWFSLCPVTNINKVSGDYVCQRLNTTTAILKPLKDVVGKECIVRMDEGAWAYSTIHAPPTGVGCQAFCDYMLNQNTVLPTTYSCKLTLNDNSQIVLKQN